MKRPAEVQQLISNVHFLLFHDLQLGEVTCRWTATTRTELEQGETASPFRNILQQSWTTGVLLVGWTLTCMPMANA